jgi:cyclohexa-1,5-dienecarbonyl-CoA hydratase
MVSTGVQVLHERGCTSISWNRPPSNVFDLGLLEELSRALREPRTREATVVVLRGEGRCWSTGLAVEDHLKPKVERMLAAFHDAMQSLWDLPGVTIAQVHGHCLGGGLELVIACDLAIGADTSKFGQPEIRLGVFPPFGVAFYHQLLGPKRAAELLYTGAMFDAERAEELGVINRRVSERELPAAVALIATSLGGYRPAALRLLKRALRNAEGAAWSHLAFAERTYLHELMAGNDAEEGLKAFLEKRSPRWDGA